MVPVYDVDEDPNGHPFFTMKRVRGLTLSKILERLAEGDAETERRHPRRRLLSAMVQLCHAVQFARERGVVHRDLKPSGSGECGWGPCMEECRQDRFDCGSADLCEALYQGCIKRCRRHYHCY